MTVRENSLCSTSENQVESIILRVVQQSSPGPRGVGV